LVSRPVKNKAGLNNTIRSIISNVKQRGDEALLKYTKELDGVSLETFKVSHREIKDAKNDVDDELKSAIQLAKSNISTFHKSQLTEEKAVETMKGVRCWRKSVPIEKVGLYIPAGSAPLFSTVLMLGIPAKLAGCKEIVLCTPPQKNRQIDPAILYTADLVGISTIYKVGGAQAIAAMAYGTETIPKVYKIFGPGNSYVTKAKEFVQQSGVAIDMPAGPSELLIIADDTCNPKFVASDLLSQAEHGTDSQVVLLSNCEEVIGKVIAEVKKQLDCLPRKEIAKKALENSFAVILNSVTECMDFSNCYAPEHLIIAVNERRKIIAKITNAGSVFIGNYSCEGVGDYASGTNHTLPTNGFAKSYSGVSVDSFMKKITFQEITAEGIQNVGPAVERMAEAEGLFAHKNAITLRLKEIRNET
jgi:histidinol dehydrogenase